MAAVDLTTAEGTSGALPAICLRCGKPAAGLYATRLYGWSARDDLAKTSYRFPLCHRHRYHFRLRNLVFFLGLTGFAAIVTVGALLSAPHRLLVSPLLILLFALGWILITGLIYILLRTNGVRVDRIRGHEVTLVNVAPEFVKAVNARRRELLAQEEQACEEADVQSIRDLMDQPVPLSEEGRRALYLARDAARQFHHDYIG